MTRGSSRLLGFVAQAAVLAASMAFVAQRASPPAGAQPSIISFTNTPLLQPNGDSEPAVTIGSDGTMVLSALSWQLFQTNIWKGPFGATPAFPGGIDTHINNGVGGRDAAVDLGPAGTPPAPTLMFFFNPKSQ